MNPRTIFDVYGPLAHIAAMAKRPRKLGLPPILMMPSVPVVASAPPGPNTTAAHANRTARQPGIER